MSPLLFTSGRQWKGGAWKWISMFNNSWWWWRHSLVAFRVRVFLLVWARESVKTPSQVLHYQLGSGCDNNIFPKRWVCLWKTLVLREDGLALFERQAAGGTDALIFQQGCSCGASCLFSAWQGEVLVESRLRSSAGEAEKMASNEQRYALQVTLLHWPTRARRKIWSQTTNLLSVIESVSCSVLGCCTNRYKKAALSACNLFHHQTGHKVRYRIETENFNLIDCHWWWIF